MGFLDSLKGMFGGNKNKSTDASAGMNQPGSATPPAPGATPDATPTSPTGGASTPPTPGADMGAAPTPPTGGASTPPTPGAGNDPTKPVQ